MNKVYDNSVDMRLGKTILHLSTILIIYFIKNEPSRKLYSLFFVRCVYFKHAHCLQIKGSEIDSLSFFLLMKNYVDLRQSTTLIVCNVRAKNVSTYHSSGAWLYKKGLYVCKLNIFWCMEVLTEMMRVFRLIQLRNNIW